MGGRAYSELELRVIRANFERVDVEVEHIARAIGRTPKQVRQYANRVLGLRRPLGPTRGAAWRHRHDGLGGCSCSSNTGRHWTGWQVDQLERLHGSLTYAEIGQRIGRSQHAVEQKARLLGLSRPRSATRRRVA